MIIKIQKPSLFLSEFIQYYWILENPSAEHTELVYPNGEIQLLFHCKNPFTENKPTGETAEQKIISLCGQRTTYSNIKTKAPSYTIGAVFFPYSAARFFPFSLSEINDYSIDLNDIFNDWQQYEESLFNSQTDALRIEIIEKFLTGRIIERDKNQYGLVSSCVQQILNNKGMFPLRKIYSHYNVSDKTLQRLFKQYTGLTPKLYSEFVRISNVIEMIKFNNNNLQTAYDNGFFDQAHFIKKIKTYTGCTPNQLLKQCGNPDVVFIQ